MIQRANQWPLIFLPTSTIYIFSTIDNHLPQKENGKRESLHKIGRSCPGFLQNKSKQVSNVFVLLVYSREQLMLPL
jgi:hypothetical protein